jgi:hypothetical protein
MVRRVFERDPSSDLTWLLTEGVFLPTGIIALLRHRRPSSELQVFSTDGTAAALDVLANMPDDDVATLEGYVEAWRELVGHVLVAGVKDFMPHATSFAHHCIYNCFQKLGHNHGDA